MKLKIACYSLFWLFLRASQSRFEKFALKLAAQKSAEEAVVESILQNGVKRRREDNVQAIVDQLKIVSTTSLSHLQSEEEQPITAAGSELAASGVREEKERKRDEPSVMVMGNEEEEADYGVPPLTKKPSCDGAQEDGAIVKVEDSRESSIVILDDVDMEVGGGGGGGGRGGGGGGRGSSEVSGSVTSSRSSSVEPIK